MARKALAEGLVRFDEAHGYRGAVKQIDMASDWGPPLADVPALWRRRALAPRGRARRQ